MSGIVVSNQSLVKKTETLSAKSNLNIHISSTPRHLKISQSMVEDFLIDPVLGATVLFKERLDEFQKARLKLCWWVPRVMDSSGFSSAKTKNLWILSNLRCLLMEDHWGYVYYQVFNTGQKAYWPYFTEVAARSPIFRAHLGNFDLGAAKDGGKATNKGQSSWACYYKNGSKIEMPAGSFSQDSKSQAGLRTNDLYIDEWTKIEAIGSEGIDEQLIQRATRKCFNQNHPLWCNHQLFLATAEDTMHPAYDRYLTFLEEVRRGNPDYALLSYSFKDYSDLPFDSQRSFKQIFREEKVLKDMKKNRSTSGYLQEGLGIWSKNGKGWYNHDVVEGCRRVGRERGIKPMVSVIDDPLYSDAKGKAKVHFFLGVDPARADQKKADDGALVALRAEPRVANPGKELTNWKLDFVWAYKVRKAKVNQWSAIIHRKNLDFLLSGIEMDSQGGGQWIRPELAMDKQRIRDTDVKVRPIGCIEDEGTMSITSQFILSMFKITDAKIHKMWGHMNMRHPDNLNDTSHQEFLEALSHGVVGFPEKLSKRPKKEIEGWSQERVHANQMLDLMAFQLTKIAVQTNNDGTTFFSNNGARRFSSKGRKDFAYAGMYAFVAFLAWLKNADDGDWSKKPYGSRRRVVGHLSHMPPNMA